MEEIKKRLVLNKDFVSVALLVLIALMTILPFVYYGKILAISDWSFHASRVEQIYRNLKAGHLFTFIATSTFNHSGVGSFLFYPTLFLYPWAFLRFIFNPVTAFYIWYFFVTIAALIIAFFSMKDFTKNRKVAFVFSLLYVFNNYRLYLGHAVFGEFIAVTFLPMAFLGLYKAFFETSQHKGWLLLPISMSLVTYSHVLSVVILVEVFIGILVTACICGKYKQIISRWTVLIKSVLIWGLLSIPVIYLFGTNYIGKGVSAAPFGIPAAMLIHLPLLISNSFRDVELFNVPFLPYGIGTVLILTAFLGWYPSRKSHKDMFIYIWGIILLFVSTNIFPWGLIKNTPLAIIQMPIRYLSYASLFLAIIAAKFIVTIFNRLSNNWLVLVVAFTALGIVNYYVSQSQYISAMRNTPISVLSKQETLSPLPTVFLNAKNYQDQFNYNVLYGETDYYPDKTLKYANTVTAQTGYFNKSKVNIKSKGLSNKLLIEFITNSHGNLDLPIVTYIDSYAKVNGRNVSIMQSERQTACVHLNKLGKNRIEIGYKPKPGFYISIVISLLSWEVLLLYKKVQNN